MRVAVSGTHLVGKTTLAEALADAMPGYRLVPEPYLTLVEEGFEFAEMPSLDEFQVQLERALEDARETRDDIIFDRCALDLLGYLATHRDRDGFQLDQWIPRVREAVTGLDLIVFVPIEDDDRIPVARAERPLRIAVDRVLREIVVDDSLGFGLDVIEVAGPPETRLRQVLTHLQSAGGR